MNNFAFDLKVFEKAAIGNSEEFIRKAAIEIYARVTIKSPVDTGRFKGNWNVSFGTQNYSINTNATSSPYRAVADDIEEIGARLDSFFGDGSIFISNGLPYAARLETGTWSKQAPQGMVEITLTEYRAFIAKQIGKSI
jgi:hypothetical protein